MLLSGVYSHQGAARSPFLFFFKGLHMMATGGILKIEFLGHSDPNKTTPKTYSLSDFLWVSMFAVCLT